MTLAPLGYDIRPAAVDDVVLLPEVEMAAGTLFSSYPGETGLTDDILAHVTSVEKFDKARAAGRLWVAVAANGDVVGFALVIELGGCAHLDELDVVPSHGRRGVGSALLNAVCAWAGRTGYPAVTLRTFRDVPWNAPFYGRRGFQIVDSSELSREHVELADAERRSGLRTDLRVSMKYPLQPQH